MCLQTRLLWKPADCCCTKRFSFGLSKYTSFPTYLLICGTVSPMWESFGNDDNNQVPLLLAIPEIKAEDVGKENFTTGTIPSLLFSYRHDGKAAGGLSRQQ